MKPPAPLIILTKLRTSSTIISTQCLSLHSPRKNTMVILLTTWTLSKQSVILILHQMKLDVLLSLDISKATGPDNIPAALLIYCAPYISSSLSNLFYKSLKLRRIPTAWKISNIVPIPKSGPFKEVTNYRSISLLGIVSKVLERCISTDQSIMSPLTFTTFSLVF